MVNLKSFKVSRKDSDSLFIEWEVSPTLEDLSIYTISLFKSEAPSELDNEYEPVVSDLPIDTPYYTDMSVKGLLSSTRSWYFYAKIKNSETLEESKFPVNGYRFVNDEAPSIQWKAILREKKLVLNKKSGRDFVLLKKRTWGTRCEVSWDPILFVNNGKICDDCTCFGTGWREGYFKPQTFRGMIQPSPNQKTLQLWGEFYPSDVFLFTTNIPPLTVGDIIVDPKTNERYEIQMVRQVSALGVPFEQQARLSLVHLDDEIYSVEAYD